MTFLKILIIAIVMTIGTVLVGWLAVPVLGAAYGVLAARQRDRRPGRQAALAAALAWGGYLGMSGFGGAPVISFGVMLGRAMQLPAATPWIATLLFPAVLAGLSAYLAAQLSSSPSNARRR